LDNIDNEKQKAIAKFNELKKHKEVIDKTIMDGKNDNKKNMSKKKTKRVSQWCPSKEWLQFAQSFRTDNRNKV
jgi:hypothetical protein